MQPKGSRKAPTDTSPAPYVTKANKSSKLNWMERGVDAVNIFPPTSGGESLESDAQDRRAPGEAAAHRLEHDKVAALDAAVADREVERERH